MLLIRFFSIILALTGLPVYLVGVSCKPRTIRDEVRVDPAAYIFKGVVLKKSVNKYGQADVLFRVSHVWRGANKREIVIRAHESNIMGDTYVFEINREYIVYAHETIYKTAEKVLSTGRFCRYRIISGQTNITQEESELKTEIEIPRN